MFSRFFFVLGSLFGLCSSIMAWQKQPPLMAIGNICFSLAAGAFPFTSKWAAVSKRLFIILGLFFWTALFYNSKLFIVMAVVTAFGIGLCLIPSHIFSALLKKPLTPKMYWGIIGTGIGLLTVLTWYLIQPGKPAVPR